MAPSSRQRDRTESPFRNDPASPPGLGLLSAVVLGFKVGVLGLSVTLGLAASGPGRFGDVDAESAVCPTRSV